MSNMKKKKLKFYPSSKKKKQTISYLYTDIFKQKIKTKRQNNKQKWGRKY